MPRIVDKTELKKTGIDKDIAKVQSEIEKERLRKETQEQPKKKKEPKWPLLYVLIAIGVFGLGILLICLMNLGLHGYFGI